MYSYRTDTPIVALWHNDDSVAVTLGVVCYILWVRISFVCFHSQTVLLNLNFEEPLIALQIYRPTATTSGAIQHSI